jgi:hypothetical protein
MIELIWIGLFIRLGSILLNDGGCDSESCVTVALRLGLDC